MAVSDSPLLRRLAVHTLAQRQDLSADEKIDWLLANVDIHDQSSHHEVFRTVRNIYGAANEQTRQTLIDSVLSFRWPDEGDEDKERRTAYQHFTWFSWLCGSDPDCALSKSARDRILERYQGLKERENPDLTHWISSGSVSPISPWSVQELVAHPAATWLDLLLSFQRTDFSGPDRRGLSEEVRKAAVQDVDWGLELAAALASTGNWQSDLWVWLFQAWSNELSEDHHRRALEWIGTPELVAEHVRPVADALLAIVEGGGLTYAPALLDLTNSIAISLRGHLDQKKPFDTETDWVMQAINHPAGTLAQYWLHSLSITRQLQDPLPHTLGVAYRAALTAIVGDEEMTGTLGKAVLCSEMLFLMGADLAWSEDSLLPLFDQF